MRAELSPAQQAHHLHRRKEIWEALGGRNSATKPQHQKQFATDTAEKTGARKSTINQHIHRAEALGDDIRHVAGTSLDKGVELDALARMSPEERSPLIEAARNGERVSARE